jgi:hypothetical protein
MTQDPKKTLNSSISKSDAIDTLWRKGILTWKLDSCQKHLYNTFKNAKYRKTVFNCSRRLGKSYTLLVIAFETALSAPNMQIKYACPTAVMAQKVILPITREILKDCPTDLIPKYVRSEKSFTFANGSVIQIEGTDEGNAEKLRGTASHLSILDEAGFMDDLMYVINDVLMPQALTTNGKMLMASTPPRSSGHPYIQLMHEAQKHGTFIKKTIMDAMEDIKNDPPHFKNRITPEIVEEFKMNYGGDLSPTWQREFMCMVQTDQLRAVLPEFTESTEKAIVVEWPKPARFDSYVSMDLGFIDFTGILFGYYDFKNAKLIIEDELLLNGHEVTTKAIAEQVRAKEQALWTDPQTQIFKEPYFRVSDDDLITLNDLQKLHGLRFIPTKKDGLELAVNQVRMMIGAQQIIIHPRCINLIFQAKAATWAKNRRTFDRSEESGHYDLIAALIYMVRNVQFQKNPYPLIETYGYDVFTKGEKVISETARSISQMFNLRKK